jgi:tRNA(fMet)-specific endonuclease VapC
MRYMLDTNIVSFAMRSRPKEVLDRLRAVRPDETCISAVTHAELRFGAARSPARIKYDALIDTFVARVTIVPFDVVAGARYADVRAALERAGTPIGDLDTLIASHALACACVLVTNDVGEFARVPGLTVEDWTA